MNNKHNVLCTFHDLSYPQFNISFEQSNTKNTYILNELYSVGQSVDNKKITWFSRDLNFIPGWYFLALKQWNKITGF